ncbi:hypothetical protein EIL87_25465 [Saccharopolyspora rhizosphaerae]|uniref:Uncharacterized protein n=1 Tax=Saccharopolyspora rhizosphaerae TaxID=2492662 RepID=A0A3R8NTN9_9PSEU|nr:hypothetical protein [Saccharopolyspora rhizosphaerae]RRO13010.1 hypothetical protein EIL87_25465 [Saccharopolyspora rhizosphaerae]
MAIDRAGRAKRREQLRAAAPVPKPERSSVGGVAMEVEGLFNVGVKHQLDHLAWVEVAKEDERESGAGPLDLDSDVVRIKPQDP